MINSVKLPVMIRNLDESGFIQDQKAILGIRHAVNAACHHRHEGVWSLVVPVP